MSKINEKMGEKLNGIGISLSELYRISKILQGCLDFYDDLETADLWTMFGILKNKIAEVKKDFNNIEEELEI